MSPVLETRGLSLAFGGVAAERDVSLRLEPGARHALIGPNGAGKTTLANLLTGVLRPGAGSVHLGGRDITDMAAHQRVRSGLARTFQVVQLFPDMTPLEAVALAATEHRNLGWRPWRPVRRRADLMGETWSWLERFGLADVAERPTASLPYGRQRLVDLAIAMACRPRVLLLDEPAAGVPEAERPGILAAVDALPAEVAVLLIEHDMDLVFAFARRITVLVAGAVLAEGTPAEVAADGRVRDVYLGHGPTADGRP